MMYGTRKELNKKLKRMFDNDEHFALLVWTKQDVMAQVENMTESEASAILPFSGSDRKKERKCMYCTYCMY